MSAKSKFHYAGPVYSFEHYIGEWIGDTWAVSEAKAMANLSFRYKTANNLLPGTKIILDPDYLTETTAIDDSIVEPYHQITMEEYMA